MPDQDDVKTITIAVDDCGNFSYQPSVARLRAGQTVSWKCEDGPFAIMFKDDTPFDRTDERGNPVSSLDAFANAGERSQPLLVSDDARGHFSYAVAVARNNRVFLDAGCPELVVN